jgi:hypothetical protein
MRPSCSCSSGGRIFTERRSGSRKRRPRRGTPSRAVARLFNYAGGMAGDMMSGITLSSCPPPGELRWGGVTARWCVPQIRETPHAIQGETLAAHQQPAVRVSSAGDGNESVAEEQPAADSRRPLRWHQGAEFHGPHLTQNCSPTMLLTALTVANLRCVAACRD